MNSLKSFKTFLCLFIIFIRKVFADYCEFGTCDENSAEYCCGENKCCKKTVEIWYYWAVVLLVIITITIAACFYVKALRSNYKTSILDPRLVEHMS